MCTTAPFGLVAQNPSSTFNFDYDGPDSLYVDSSCTAILDWGHPDEPTCTVSGPGLFLISFDLWSISGGYSMGDSVPAGEQIVIQYRAQDNMGNIEFFGFTLPVVDTIPPEFLPSSLPADTTIQCMNYPDTPQIEYSDNCAISPAGLTFSEVLPTSFCTLDTLYRTWTLTDTFGIQSTYTQHILIQPDTFAPVIDSVPLSSSSPCDQWQIQYDQWLEEQRMRFSAHDIGCGGLILSDDGLPSSLLGDTCGIIRVEFTAEDSCGNRATVNGTFEILDDDPPVLNNPAQNDTFYCDEAGAFQAFQIWIAEHGGAQAIDSCSAVHWSTQPANPLLNVQCDSLTPVTFIADDGCGNTVSTQAAFAFRDTTPPVFAQAPLDTIVYCSEGRADSLFMNWANQAGFALPTDLCTPAGGFRINWYAGGNSLDSAELEQLFRDSFDASCLQQVELNGMTLDRVKAFVPLEFGISDLCGNEIRADARFVLRDTSAPVWTALPESISLDCDSLADPIDRLESWYADAGGGAALDDCDTALIHSEQSLSELIDQFRSSQDSSCGQTGEVSARYFAADPCGNTSEAYEVSFRVIDTIAPVWMSDPQSQTTYCEQALDSSLIPWLDGAGNGLWMDGCDSATLDSFQWVTASGLSGSGLPYSGPYPDVPDSICSDSIHTTFFISDACGNHSSRMASFNITDTVPPEIVGLTDSITVSCDNVPDPDDVEIMDNCSPVLSSSVSDSSTQSQDSLDCGHYQYEIYRTFSATDDCGNNTERLHLIRVRDLTPPMLNIPPDTVISCSALDSLQLSAEATDQCSPVDSLYFNDVISNGICQQVVQRIWTARDVCGNTRVDTQEITLIDDEPPVLETDPVDRQVQCGPLDSIRNAFQNWLEQAGQAEYFDRCHSVSWFAAFPGSYQLDDPSTYPDELPEWPDTMTCPPADTNGLTVGFVFYDPCGNANEQFARFRVIDTLPPSISFSDSAEVEYVDASSCTVHWIVDQPNLYDACGIESSGYDLRDSAAVTSEMPGDGETVVNPVDFSFPVLGAMGTYPDGEGVLEIELHKVDGEGQYEHYIVYGEDGDSLGQTDSLNLQCGTGSTYFTLSRDRLYEWYRDDSQIDFRLEPVYFDSLEARYFINDICPAGEVRARLQFGTTPLSTLSLYYAVDSMDFVPWPAGGIVPDTVPLDAGLHNIRYRVEDCAGNRTEFSREVNVLDTISPSISCPSDTFMNLPGDTCQRLVNLSVPENFQDNCSAERFELNAPALAADRWLTFSLDPNTNDYIADQKVLTFTGVQANAIGPVRLHLNVLGNVDEPEAYFIVMGEQNDTLGTTAMGQSHVEGGSCNDPLLAAFDIPEQKYNSWASDGEIRITLRPNRMFSPPPGGFGDGINPCDRNQVTEDGDIDSISRVTAKLAGQAWHLTYEISGATTVDETSISDPDFVPAELLGAGTNEVRWTARDDSGNRNSCSYVIELRDTINPVARCRDIILNIPPTGNEIIYLDPEHLDDGSYDNCTIEQMEVTPDSFRCDQVGELVTVLFSVEDDFGNRDSCTAEVRVERSVLEPSYLLDICDPDTLYLLSNLPDSIDTGVLTFEWTGPNGFQSQLKNPFIPNVNDDYSGTYTFKATGLNGCYAEGTVEVIVEMIQTPVIQTGTPLVCEGESIQLSTQGYTGDVTYRWYRGLPPNGVLLGSTVAPSFTLSPSPPEGQYEYYVVLVTPDCSSNPSNTVEVEVITTPQAQIEPLIQVLCEGETLSFTSSSNPLFSFDWSGPNGFSSTLRNPMVTDSVIEGFEGEYSLVVSLGSCISQPVSAEVIVNPRPARPILQAPSVVCAGEPLTLTVTNINDGDTYRWHHPDGSVINAQDPVLTIQDASLQEAGAWWVEIVEENCTSPGSDTVLIGVEDISYFEAANDGPICEGDSVFVSSDPIDGADYQWTGPGGFSEDSSSFLIPAEEGIYHVTVTTENGCTATSSTVVETKPRPEITGIQNQGIICSDGELDVCFNISVFPPDNGNYQYEWQGPNAFFSNEAEPCIENADESDNGVYTLTVIQDGCPSKSVNTVLNVVDVASQPPLVGASEYCAGDSIILETSPYSGFNVKYFWITPNGQRTTDVPRLIIPDAGGSDGGIYEVYVKVENCETERSEPLEIEIYTTPAVPQIEGTTSVCSGDSVLLSVDLPIPGVTYEWTGPAGTSHSGSSWTRFPAADSMEGEYTVEAIRGICRSSASEPLYVDVQAIPQIPDIESFPEAICRDRPAGEPLCIDPETASPGASYEWMHVETGLELQSGAGLCAVLEDLELIPPGIQHVYVRAFRNGCVSDYSIPVTIQIDTIPEIEADAGMDGIFCPGTVHRLSSVNPGQGMGQWEALNPGVLVLEPNHPKSEVVDVPTGTLEFVWSLSNGACTHYSRDTVSYDLPAPFQAEDDYYTGSPGSVLSVQPLANDLTTTDGVLIRIIRSPSVGELTGGSLPWNYDPAGGFIGRDSARYEICSEECPDLCDTATIYFRIGDESDCTVPTIFTPNDDGINDNLVIPCLVKQEYENNRLIIFNQWGDEIYRASPYTNNWNGTYNGDPLPPGTYYYSLEIEGKNIRRSGFIIIER